MCVQGNTPLRLRGIGFPQGAFESREGVGQGPILDLNVGGESLCKGHKSDERRISGEADGAGEFWRLHLERHR
jgi:hypothetical protein